jgi:hypothetical protein
MSDLYQGAVAPEAYSLLVLQGDSGLDMTTVTSAVFVVEKADGIIVTWAGTISAAITSQLKLTHSFVSAPSEVDQSGSYKIYVLLTVPGGFRGTERLLEPVRSQFEVP